MENEFIVIIIKNKFKIVRIKNRTCYYFDDITKLEDFDIDNILRDQKKSHENIFIYGILCKTLIDPKSLSIRFNKIDGFIRIYDETRNLILGSEKYVTFCDSITYLISLKSGITHIFSCYFAKIKIDS